MVDDTRLVEALRRTAVALEPDVADGLRMVHQGVHRRTARRRVAVLVLTAALVLAVAVLAHLLAGTRSTRPQPVRPIGERVGLDVTAQHSARSFGTRQVLGLAVAPDGHLYLTTGDQQVLETTADLHVVRRWGGPGTAPGRFRMSQGQVAVGNDGRVYVSDAGNFRVQVFSPDGRFLTSMGSFGSGPGEFIWPFDLTVDTAGDVYLADDRTTTLTKMSPDGHQLWRRGTEKDPDARMRGHFHFAGFDRGDLLAANDDRGVVLRIDAHGRVVTAYGSRAQPYRTAGGWSGPFPDGACDATTDESLVFVGGCADSDARHSGVILDAAHHPIGSWPRSAFITSPRFGPGDRAYAVSSSGGVAELAVTRH